MIHRKIKINFCETICGFIITRYSRKVKSHSMYIVDNDEPVYEMLHLKKLMLQIKSAMFYVEL